MERWCDKYRNVIRKDGRGGRYRGSVNETGEMGEEKGGWISKEV